MRAHRLIFPATALLLSYTGASLAAPAAPNPQPIQLTSGQWIQARAQGDEWCHWLSTPDGRRLTHDARGRWQLASSPRPSGCQGSPWQARTQTERRAGPLETPVLLLLAEFTDQKGTYAPGLFADRLALDVIPYYEQVSLGAIQLEAGAETSGVAGDGVVGWLSLPRTHPNTAGQIVSAENRQVVADAIEAADPYVDYARYDVDGNGIVNSAELAVVVVVAGSDASYNGSPAPAVWAQSWWLSPTGTPVVDGVRVAGFDADRGGYALIGERHGGGDELHMASMGPLVHELGHLIWRLPDLYDPDDSSNGVGAYCLMGSGSWGWAWGDPWHGTTPVMPSAFVRSSLEWLTPETVPGEITLLAAGSPDADLETAIFRADTSQRSEYFLVENRQQVGWDRGLENLIGGFGGLAIWHIDEQMPMNRVDSHRRVDLEEAHNADSGWEPTSLWSAENPGISGGFTPTSSPNSNLYSGSTSGVSVRNFSPSGQRMSCEIGL